MFAQDPGPLMALAAQLAGRPTPPAGVRRFDDGVPPGMGPGPQDGSIEYMRPPMRRPMPQGMPMHPFLPNTHGQVPPEMIKRLAAIMAGQMHAQQFAGKFPRR